ncbi:cyclic-di-AMP-binding protein CbpB [Fundicoccus culcitae]|uniref:CBS domain-containing protein n=1 Tax=Fundicoccus culcitae TaxID=2969821 RepID=A0ABY5P7F1_9LACT|nr:cyclic-di-AMP-binding protein CbpB [Fundicoccus culcitae]UUX34368.1 CBS domain-containing protein [Fundicoccus culcitae]
MIDPLIEDALWNNVEDIMIEADNVANVATTNTLNHGLLVLSQMKYSVIPVLTPKSKLAGLVSMPLIINGVMTDDAFLTDQLDTMTISEIMYDNPVTINLDSDLEEILHLLIDNNFICVVSEVDNHFLGIVTRSAVIKRFNKFVHTFSKQTELKEVVDYTTIFQS